MSKSPMQNVLFNLRASLGALQGLFHEESGPLHKNELAAANQVASLCRSFLEEIYANEPQEILNESMEDEMFFQITVEEILNDANERARKEMAKQLGDSA